MLKKKNSGKLDAEETEILRLHSTAQSKSPDRSANHLGSNYSFLHENNNQSNRSTSREAKPVDRGLPLLNPQLNINDITYSIKEKITINTVPNKHMGATVNNFNLYLKSPAKHSDYGHPMSSSVVKPLSRDPKNDFRRATDRGATGASQQAHQHGTQGMTINYGASKNAASRSFDFENKASPHAFAQTSKRFRTTQGGSTDYHTHETTAPPMSDSEPKSRKLLEMMLKRISRLNVDDAVQAHQTVSGSGTGASFGPRFMGAPRPSSELRTTFENKSVSLDHNKKKLNITMSRNQDSSNQSRRNSRESGHGGTGMVQSMSNHSSALPSKVVTSNKQQKHISIRPVRMRNAAQHS